MKSFDWTTALGSVNSESFRLQTLPQYSVSQEDQDFENFLSGEPLPVRSNHSWLQQIKSNVDSGKRWINVHVVPESTTPYFRYILEWWYFYWAQQGADVRFVLPSVSNAVRVKLNEDFYLLDNSKVIQLEYGEGGIFIGADYLNDTSRLDQFREKKEIAIKNSVNLKEYLSLLRREND